jgi:branched-subunit amino acid ABC-type transport system permease component
MRRVVIILALCLLPAALPAQRVASERAGFAPRVALVRFDTVSVDSVAPHRRRVVDAIGGGIIGALAGGLAGGIYAEFSTQHCTGDMCGLAGLAVIPAAGIGLVVGTIAGALWPVR